MKTIIVKLDDINAARLDWLQSAYGYNNRSAMVINMIINTCQDLIDSAICTPDQIEDYHCRIQRAARYAARWEPEREPEEKTDEYWSVIMFEREAPETWIDTLKKSGREIIISPVHTDTPRPHRHIAIRSTQDEAEKIAEELEICSPMPVQHNAINEYIDYIAQGEKVIRIKNGKIEK